MMLLLGRLNAQEKLTAFPLDLSHRLRNSGRSPSDLNLRMTRAEIGSFLGLTLETEGRTLSTFRPQGLLSVENRHIRFIDLDSFAVRFEAVLRG